MKPKHQKGFWKDFFNNFSYGLSCEYEADAKKIFWKYHQNGIIKRSKFRISVEKPHDDGLWQGYLYYKDIDESVAWMEWLKTHLPDTKIAIDTVIKEGIITQYELEQRNPNLFISILTTFGNHDFIVKRHFICSGKPILYCRIDISKQEIDDYIDNQLHKEIYGKKSDAVKQGFKFQNKVFDILSNRIKESDYDILAIEKEKYFKVDGHNVRFDFFAIVKSPAFNTPMFIVAEVKHYVLGFKHLSHILMFDYKCKKVFGNAPIMKFLICKGANPTELFKRAYELGITLLTSYEKANKELVVYPKGRVKT